MVPGRVLEAHAKTNGQVVVGGIVGERLSPNGHVKVASGVAGKRPRTNPDVITAGSIVVKRIGAHGGIVNSAGEVEQSVSALRCVASGIASVWRWDDRLRARRKRKAGE